MTHASALDQTERLIRDYSEVMRRHLQQHVDGTNINGQSLLTTDYLNHYSGMVMLLEQLPETPEELIIYLLSWRPVSYEEHFETSGFRDGDMAIAAYRHAPAEIRASFDAIIERLHEQSLKAIELVSKQAEQGNIDALARTCEEHAPILRELIDEASGVVNQGGEGQDDIDAMFGG
jgi:hypothetical protein